MNDEQNIIIYRTADGKVVKEFLTTAADGKNYNVVFLPDAEDIKVLEEIEKKLLDQNKTEQ